MDRVVSGVDPATEAYLVFLGIAAAAGACHDVPGAEVCAMRPARLGERPFGPEVGRERLPGPGERSLTCAGVDLRAWASMPSSATVSSLAVPAGFCLEIGEFEGLHEEIEHPSSAQLHSGLCEEDPAFPDWEPFVARDITPGRLGEERYPPARCREWIRRHAARLHPVHPIPSLTVPLRTLGLVVCAARGWTDTRGGRLMHRLVEEGPGLELVVNPGDPVWTDRTVDRLMRRVREFAGALGVPDPSLDVVREVVDPEHTLDNELTSSMPVLLFGRARGDDALPDPLTHSPGDMRAGFPPMRVHDPIRKGAPRVEGRPPGSVLATAECLPVEEPGLGGPGRHPFHQADGLLRWWTAVAGGLPPTLPPPLLGLAVRAVAPDAEARPGPPVKAWVDPDAGVGEAETALRLVLGEHGEADLHPPSLEVEFAAPDLDGVDRPWAPFLLQTAPGAVTVTPAAVRRSLTAGLLPAEIGAPQRVLDESSMWYAWLLGAMLLRLGARAAEPEDVAPDAWCGFRLTADGMTVHAPTGPGRWTPAGRHRLLANVRAFAELHGVGEARIELAADDVLPGPTVISALGEHPGCGWCMTSHMLHSDAMDGVIRDPEGTGKTGDAGPRAIPEHVDAYLRWLGTATLIAGDAGLPGGETLAVRPRRGVADGLASRPALPVEIRGWAPRPTPATREHLERAEVGVAELVREILPGSDDGGDRPWWARCELLRRGFGEAEDRDWEPFVLLDVAGSRLGTGAYDPPRCREWAAAHPELCRWLPPVAPLQPELRLRGLIVCATRGWLDIRDGALALLIRSRPGTAEEDAAHRGMLPEDDRTTLVVGEDDPVWTLPRLNALVGRMRRFARELGLPEPEPDMQIIPTLRGNAVIGEDCRNIPMLVLADTERDLHEAPRGPREAVLGALRALRTWYPRVDSPPVDGTGDWGWTTAPGPVPANPWDVAERIPYRPEEEEE